LDELPLIEKMPPATGLYGKATLCPS